MHPHAYSFPFHLSFLYLRSAVEASLNMKKFHRNETGSLISTQVSRTYGVSIFIDYCPAAAIQRKVKERERDTGLITRMRLAAMWPGATWTLMACAGRGALTRVPLPPPTLHPPPSPIGLWTDFGSLAQSRGWPPFLSL